MGVLDDAIGLQTRAISELTGAKSSADAWSDFKRQELDRSRLEPLEQDVKHLLGTLRRAAREISQAQQKLLR